MKKPYIVGISGGSCSGKSTIQDVLKEKICDLNVKGFHMDDYYRQSEERPVITGLWNGKRYIDDNHPQSLNFEQFYIDFEEALKEDWDVILVEGVFVLWDEKILPHLDLKLYVDCDPDERMARRIKRHLSFGEDLDEITERYIHAVKNRHMEYVEPTKWKADFILNGFQMPSLGISVVAAWILEKTSS